MLVFYKIIDDDTFYFTGRDSDLNPVLSVFIEDAMHFNVCGYEILNSMYDNGFQPMWGK